MADLFKKYNVNEKVALEGVEFYFGDDISITLKSISKTNKAFHNAYNFFLQDKRIKDISKMPEALLPQLYSIYIKHCIVDWKNVEFKGKKLKFNEANALLVFVTCDGLFNECFENSANVSSFQEVNEAQDLKN